MGFSSGTVTLLFTDVEDSIGPGVFHRTGSGLYVLLIQYLTFGVPRAFTR
jgi:hypothetical protein